VIGVCFGEMPESLQPRPKFDDVPLARRRNLAAVGPKNTVPELTVRRLLHGMGYRFRLHRRDLPGTPDIVLAGRRKIIEVRGCFWHRHPDPACRNAVLPKVRAEWWEAKLARNVERDERNLAALRDAGWSVLVLWECEAKHETKLAALLRSFLV
jgi:DNA mismatch endonuclease Vsr